jgi:hypothetical protein
MISFRARSSNRCRDATGSRRNKVEMFHIGQRVICVDDRFVGENRVFDPTFTVRCPNLPVKGHIYTVRGFVVPYAGYPGTPGILLEEIINPPSPYFMKRPEGEPLRASTAIVSVSKPECLKWVKSRLRSGVRPWSRTGLGGGFDRLPGVASALGQRQTSTPAQAMSALPRRIQGVSATPSILTR